MPVSVCSECGAEVRGRVERCPVCRARIAADASGRAATVQRVLKGDALRALGVAIGFIGIVVLLAAGSRTLGIAALGLAVALCIIGGVRV